MPEKFVPLRIDLDIGGPMAVPDRHPILLDAVLLAMLRKRLPLPFEPSTIPVATARSAAWPSDQFIWLASHLVVDYVGPVSDRILHRNARPMELLDDAQWHNATSVDHERGLTKVSRTRIAVRQATKATAWCLGVGQSIQALLDGLQALGAHRHLGLGLVRSIQVTDDDRANKHCWMRPLPGPHASDPFAGERWQAPGRAIPPYWDTDLTQQAWWPSVQ